MAFVCRCAFKQSFIHSFIPINDAGLTTGNEQPLNKKDSVALRLRKLQEKDQSSPLLPLGFEQGVSNLERLISCPLTKKEKASQRKFQSLHHERNMIRMKMQQKIKLAKMNCAPESDHP